jgi:hypothetical protein
MLILGIAASLLAYYFAFIVSSIVALPFPSII